MKPDWDKLMKAFKDDESRLVADVDCTAAGKPVCDPAKMDLCEPAMKEKILELQKLSAADLDKQIKEKEAEIENAEKTFTDEVDKLQKAYQKLQEDKEATVTAVKDSGLG